MVFLYSLINAQSVFKNKFEPKSAILMDVSFKQQYPGADMAKRFGKNASLGMDVSYKSKSNWFVTIGGHFIFGNTVLENGILDSLKSKSTGEIFDQNGQFATVGLDQRGMFLGASLAKTFPISKVNKNSGIYLALGGGYLQHRIRIYTTSTVPQLTDKYKKGYDRFTFGPALTQSIGYRFLDPKKRLNFFFGFEMTEGFTQNRRSVNFDTRIRDTEKRLDLLYGIKLSLTIPLYLKKLEEEEFFE